MLHLGKLGHYSFLNKQCASAFVVYIYLFVLLYMFVVSQDLNDNDKCFGWAKYFHEAQFLQRNTNFFKEAPPCLSFFEEPFA